MKDIYEELLKRTKFGKGNLEKVKIMDAKMGFLSQQFKSIQIAGTNGKGSVATKIAWAFIFSGYKTALFTSPHIFSFRERICINGKKISKKEMEEGLCKIFKIADSLHVRLTFFEATVLLAFYYFSKKKVEIAILETGIGGRLDATNIVKGPILSVITSISIDHSKILGNTNTKIAREKAGVIKKRNNFVVIGPKANFFPIRKKAKKEKVPFYMAKEKKGFFDFQNREIAKLCLDLLIKKGIFKIKKEIIEKALLKRPKFRFKVIKNSNNKILKSFPSRPKAIILDVAHNPDGFYNLLKSVNIFFKNSFLKVVLSMSKKKEIKPSLKEIVKFANSIHLIDGKNENLLSKEKIFSFFKEIKFTNVYLEKSIKDFLQKSFKKEDVIVFCGSFYIMQDIENALKNFSKKK